MGKISPVSAKYIVYATIQVEGIVDKPDVIGAIFGQTEGLLGTELELRELQRSGRIGRIDVRLEVKQGKTAGEIIVPSSLDKTETAIIAASLETIQKIGPCDSAVKIEKVEDVRISKRTFVLDRAKELLKDLTNVMPDSQEIANEVSDSVKMMNVHEYGKDRLSAGPGIENVEEIILVEGRADVLNLLKHGINNVIGIGGTDVSESVRGLCQNKIVTIFVDGDRGGDLIIKRLANMIKIDFIARAPDGKEVEELTSKEIIKSIRSKVPFEQKTSGERTSGRREQRTSRFNNERRPERRFIKKIQHKEEFKSMLDKLIGTKGSFILDKDLNILGKVPVSELTSTIKGLRNGIYALVLDGQVTRDLAYIAERIKVKYIIGTESDDIRSREITIIIPADLE